MDVSRYGVDWKALGSLGVSEKNIRRCFMESTGRKGKDYGRLQDTTPKVLLCVSSRPKRGNQWNCALAESAVYREGLETYVHTRMLVNMLDGVLKWVVEIEYAEVDGPSPSFLPFFLSSFLPFFLSSFFFFFFFFVFFFFFFFFFPFFQSKV